MEYSNWYWILLTVLLIERLSATEGCLEQERVALLQLKSFFYDPNGYLSDWEDSVKGSNCCEWERVHCSISSKRVIQLSLNDTRQSHRAQYEYLNLSLFLPFTELKSLDLSWNKLAGFVENEGFAKIGSAFKKLEILDLSHNQLNESILTPLSQISSLKSLYLSQNEITTAGSNHTDGIAKLSSGLKKLEILDLSYNSFKLNESMLSLSSLSELSSLKSLYLSAIFNFLRGSNHTNGFEWLSRLDHLETLDLSGNSLGNDILSHVATLSSLKTLNLGYNQLNGDVNTKELSRMRKLRNLDLSYNGLDNSILGVVSALSNLESLNLGGNRLKGSINIIKELEGLHDLQELDFSSNELHPNILEIIGALTSLKSLTLSNCSLTGPLPTKGWCDLWNLEKLDVNGNALEGSIPPCFHNLSSLRFLDISDNHIEVPSSFSSFTNKSNLKFLFIDHNNLVREPTFWTKKPKFQLLLLRMPNCTTKGLPKQLPHFLHYQYDLRFLDLSYNNFDEQYPYWLLENNTRLQQFLMAGNSFKGPLRLPKHANIDMFELDMSGNKMEVQIPMNICSTFPKLVSFSLSRNAFEGNIPPCLLGDLKSLNELDLSFNNLSGGIIVEELGKSTSLKILRLSNNNLSGTIPPTLFTSSPLLQKLYLDGNNFDGEIPLLDASTLSFSILSDIDLSNNHFSGKLPKWIWNLSNLVDVVFSNNHFDGDRIPLELCNLGWLRFLGLSQNNLFGSVPSCFSSLTRLEHLYLNKNKLSGPLPHALYNSSSLVSLDLSHNNFTGIIPNWICTLSALRILILKANHFEGEIPSQICRLNSLSMIDLSQNKLFGKIPSCLSNLTLEPDKSFQVGFFVFFIKVLKDVDPKLVSGHSYPNNYVVEKVAFGTKKELYTYSGNILKYMSGIDLSCNMLTGKIPPELGNLSELLSLNLSHNKLVGCIPSTFSKLKQIESLDISHNKLSGTILIQLMELNYLEVFNVSYNNFSGSIPYEKAQFATFDESSYFGNPFLCGPPKHESCSTETYPVTRTPNASGNEDQESDFLDKESFFVTFGVSYTIVLVTIGVILFINPYWRRVWLYFIQQCIDTFYYFIVDNVVVLFIFRRWP